MDGREHALLAAGAAHSKKANDVVVLDIQRLSPFNDYFVIGSGNSSTQVRAIAEAVEKKMKEAGVILHHREGHSGKSGWMLLDYGAVVVHIFHDDQRSFYDLERLWGDAERVELSLA